MYCTKSWQTINTRDGSVEAIGDVEGGFHASGWYPSGKYNVQRTCASSKFPQVVCGIMNKFDRSSHFSLN